MKATKTSLNKWIHATSHFIVLISTCPIRQMLANFSGVEFENDYIEVQEKKKKVVVLCSHPWQNKKLGTFTLQSCSEGKEISCGFANLNLLLFCRSLLSLLLKLPNNLILGNLNGALIFSDFEQILAIKMAPIQGFQ